MTTSTVPYIWCPGCECTVRELTPTPCPNCGRCAFCGRKLKPGETCSCGNAAKPDQVDRLVRNCGVPAAEVPREQHRAEIRKQLEGKKGLVRAIVGVGGIMWGGKAIEHAFAGLPPLGKWALVGAYYGVAVCLLIYATERIFRRIENRRLDREFAAGD